MPILDERHDFMHPVEPDTAWSESYYFNAYDPASDTGIFTRIGIRPNEGTADASLSVWLPGQELATIRAVRPQHEMIDNVLEVEGVRYECVAPMKEWHIQAEQEARVQDLSGEGKRRKTNVALDLRFHALIPAIGADGQSQKGSGASAETRKSVGKGHLEQAGRWSGWVEVDGTRHDLREARGNRDKSWGPRRWGGPRMWRWFSINVGDDVHFGGIRIATEAGDLHRGWVWRDGKAASIRDWSIRTELAEDGITHRVSHVRATDKTGRSHELRADLLRVAPALRERDGIRTVVNEGLARWTYEGRTGYGISEYLHQLDPEGRPLVPIE